MHKKLNADVVHEYLQHFKPISEMTENTQNIKCTFYCEEGRELEDIGYVFNSKFNDLGLTMLIVKKFIRHDELLKMMK